jgi:uncharacterized membrane protein
MLVLEQRLVFQDIEEKLPYLFIRNVETARVILATLISGIISLTVFSFSMVMVLLNQASTNYSPRLLPGLISDKRNQGVLGIYIGSLVYNILVLIAVLPDSQNKSIIGFSVFIGIVLGIICLGFFVFFIHAISTAIQIGTILKETQLKAKKDLERIKNSNDFVWLYEAPIRSEWDVVYSPVSGYLQDINIDRILEKATQLKTNIVFLNATGLYILEGHPLMGISQQISEEQKRSIIKLVNITENIDLRDKYLMGVRHISEVGIKAMSPGINDPGTAITTLDYLSEIFRVRMEIGNYRRYDSEETNFWIIVPEVSFSDLLYDTMAAYRNYCSSDFNVAKKLISFLQYLSERPIAHPSYREEVKKQQKILIDQLEENISNPEDILTLKKLLLKKQK